MTTADKFLPDPTLHLICNSGITSIHVQDDSNKETDDKDEDNGDNSHYVEPFPVHQDPTFQKHKQERDASHFDYKDRNHHASKVDQGDTKHDDVRGNEYESYHRVRKAPSETPRPYRRERDMVDNESISYFKNAPSKQHSPPPTSNDPYAFFTRNETRDKPRSEQAHIAQKQHITRTNGFSRHSETDRELLRKAWEFHNKNLLETRYTAESDMDEVYFAVTAVEQRRELEEHIHSIRRHYVMIATWVEIICNFIPFNIDATGLRDNIDEILARHEFALERDYYLNGISSRANPMKDVKMALAIGLVTVLFDNYKKHIDAEMVTSTDHPHRSTNKLRGHRSQPNKKSSFGKPKKEKAGSSGVFETIMGVAKMISGNTADTSSDDEVSEPVPDRQPSSTSRTNFDTDFRRLSLHNPITQITPSPTTNIPSIHPFTLPPLTSHLPSSATNSFHPPPKTNSSSAVPSVPSGDSGLGRSGTASNSKKSASSNGSSETGGDDTVMIV